jgi:hypothetical protein
MNKSKNVFISHYGKDDEHVQALKAKLAERGYTIKNSSIDSTKKNNASNPEYIKRLLRLRIQWAGKFICLVGPKTHTRPWVDWEIEQAHKKGKQIMGIFTHGSASDSKLPDNLEKYRDQLVGWNFDKIIDGLESNSPHSENPDGSSRPVYTPVHRVKCQ